MVTALAGNSRHLDTCLTLVALSEPWQRQPAPGLDSSFGPICAVCQQRLRRALAGGGCADQQRRQLVPTVAKAESFFKTLKYEVHLEMLPDVLPRRMLVIAIY